MILGDITSFRSDNIVKWDNTDDDDDDDDDEWDRQGKITNVRANSIKMPHLREYAYSDRSFG